MVTLTYICKDKKEVLSITSKCVKNEISFEFMNSLELYFYIYDAQDFKSKQLILSDKIINYSNATI